MFPPLLSLLFLSSVAYGGETPLPTFLIRASVFLLFAILLWARPRVGWRWSHLDLPAGSFILYSIVATSWAVYPWAAYQYALNILCVGLVYFLVRCQEGEGDGERETARVMAAILLAAAVQVALELLQRVSGRAGGLWGSFANSNFLAGYLFFGLVAALGFAWKGTAPGFDVRKTPYFALAALMGYGICLTQSRAMAAVAAGVSLFLIVTARGRQRALYLAGAAAGGALLAAAVATRFSAALDPYAFSRLNMWKAAWKTAVAHPIGVGLGGYKFFWLRFREPIEGAVFRFGKTADTAHSHFFGILSELGFPGVLLAVAIVCAVLVLVWREGRREDRILPLCLIPLGATIHAFFDVNLEPLGIALPVAACTALLANRNARGGKKGLSLSPVLRAAPSLVLLLCVGYSAAACLGYHRYRGGLESLGKGDTKEAMTGFSSAERCDPLNSAYPDAVSSVHYRWYLRTRRAEYLAAAVNAEQRAVAASPEDSLHLSQAGFLLGELAEAVPDEEQRRAFREFSLSALDESLRKNPFGVVAGMRKAEVLRRAGKTEAARDILERTIAIEPNAAIVHLMLARLEEPENPGKAAERYRMAIARSRELERMPLDLSQREFLRFDRTEIERRAETLERGHFPSPSGGQ
jgi:O-antigen ligase/tetratricopeptide (TPR) repeat protein